MSKWGFSRGGSRRRRVAALLAVLSALAVGALALVTQAGASQSAMVSVERAGAAPSGSTALGEPEATASQSGDVVLKPRDPAALQSFLSAVTTKGSSEYHHYLAGGAFASQFGPTQATIDAVKSTLTGDGLKVTGVSSNGMMVAFSGDTSEVESAFDTKLENYKTPAGVTGEEAITAVQLPSTIAPDVTSVVGLDTTLKATDSLTKGTPAAAANYPAAKTADITNYPSGAPDPTCSGATTAATEYGGLTDDQIANAYGAFGEYATNDTGAGVHVGVYELEPFETSDLQTFDSCYFGATQASAMVNDQLSITNVDGGPGTGPGSGEAILDVEDVSAMAPGADIDVYQAPNSIAGGLEAYDEMIDNDVDKVITSSWGFCEADEQIDAPGYQQAEYYLFEQAAAQGQTVLNATGDTGSDSCNEVRSTPPPTDQQPLSVGDPASQPYVMAVGGTTIQDADPSNYDETVWNDGANWGGGNGGISNTWAAPSWQTVVSGFPLPGGSVYTDADNVLEDSGSNGLSEPGEPWDTPGAAEFCAANTNLPAGTPCRTLPDVSADADEFTGAVTIYQAASGGWLTIGGTSSATPIWAGMLALVDASQPCQADGVPVAQGIGFAVPELYAVADNASEYAESFHDITVGNNDVYGFDNGESFAAGTGYDLASGLGSPVLTNPDGTPGLAANLCAIAGTTTPPPTITALAPASGPTAGGGTETVTLASALPAGTTVSSVSVGNALVTSGITASGTSVSFTLPAGSDSLANGPTTNADASTDTTFTSAGAEGSQDGAGPAAITLTLSNGQSTQLNTSSLYEYVDQTGGDATPTVTGIEPYAGLESAPTQVTVYGSGFDATDEVFVGSVQVPAANVDVISPYELKVTPPAYSSSTNCPTAKAITKEVKALGGSEPTPATDDICQTNIRVLDTSDNDESATSAPNPAYEGAAVALTQDGLPEVPTGFELAPSPTEYDYIPTPTITGVYAASDSSSTPTPVTTTDPSTLADASGGSIVYVTGTGLNPLTLDYFLVGNPTLNSSIDFNDLFYSGTEAVIELPADPNVAKGGTVGTQPDSVPITASTVAGNSASGADAIYAGIPTVSSVSTGSSDEGYSVAPDSGGSPLTITGQGFSDATGPLELVDNVSAAAYGESFSTATQYTYTVNSDTGITTEVPETNPAILDTEVCTESGCSAPVSADQLIAYPPGNPEITGIDTSSGPASGGTTVTITGENLGCVTSVEFGGVPALAVANTPALLDCGSTSSVTVIAPPGTAGSTVPITLTTVESDVAGTSATATSPTQYTYAANPAASPSPEDFGSVDVGSSNTQAVTITNPGTTTVDLAQATITGANAGEFAITSDGCSSTDLGAGDSCTEQIEFSPTGSGTQNATLDIPFDSSPTDITAALTGTGTIPTQTVTTPPTTVTTPGTTVTTTVPGPTQTTTTIEVYRCTKITKYKTKTVTKKVKVKGKTKTEKVKEKVPYKVKYCKLVKKTTNSNTNTALAKPIAKARK